MAQLGERRVRIAEAEGSNPFGSTMSEQALYRLLRLFYKSQSAHAAALSFPIEPAALDFDSDLNAALKVVASIVSRWYKRVLEERLLFGGGFAVKCSL